MKFRILIKSIPKEWQNNSLVVFIGGIASGGTSIDQWNHDKGYVHVEIFNEEPDVLQKLKDCGLEAYKK